MGRTVVGRSCVRVHGDVPARELWLRGVRGPTGVFSTRRAFLPTCGPGTACRLGKYAVQFLGLPLRMSDRPLDTAAVIYYRQAGTWNSQACDTRDK